MAKKTQFEKFKEKAREIGADESEDNFDATLKKVALAVGHKSSNIDQKSRKKRAAVKEKK